MFDNTYWNHSGKHQDKVDALQALVPAEGPVKGSKNKALERFRKAVNCYYDLYNNGLCNRAASFAKIFKVAPSDYGVGYTARCLRVARFGPTLYEIVEKRMDEIIEAAVAEQGL